MEWRAVMQSAFEALSVFTLQRVSILFHAKHRLSLMTGMAGAPEKDTPESLGSSDPPPEDTLD